MEICFQIEDQSGKKMVIEGSLIKVPTMEFMVFGRYFIYAYCALGMVAALLSAMQEKKAFRDVGLGPVGFLKAYTYVCLWMLGSFLGSLLVLPFALLGFDVKKFVIQHVEYNIAMWLCRFLLGPVQVNGLSNLPPVSNSGKPVVYVMNHQSMVDIIVLYFLRRRSVWIAKKSVCYLPGVGGIMLLAGHILLDRKGKGSIKQMYKKADEKLKRGYDIFIFPQGTRERTITLPFKHGGFSIAMESQCDIIPVSIFIEGSAWKSLFPILASKPIATLTVHKKLEISKYSNDDKGKEFLMSDSFDAIYSVLEKKKWEGEKFQKRVVRK